MKVINPEKSCILDVGEHRAEELKECGWMPYVETEIKVTPKTTDKNNTKKKEPVNKGKKK